MYCKKHIIMEDANFVQELVGVVNTYVNMIRNHHMVFAELQDQLILTDVVPALEMDVKGV